MELRGSCSIRAGFMAAHSNQRVESAWSEAPVDRLNQIQTYAFNHETIVASKITP